MTGSNALRNGGTCDLAKLGDAYRLIYESGPHDALTDIALATLRALIERRTYFGRYCSVNPKSDPYSPEFDWLVFLEEVTAPDAKPVALDVHMLVETKAMEWPTCACGQLCKALPRFDNCVPKDQVLGGLGVEFCEAVGEKNWNAALAKFRVIEERTAQLLILQKESTPQ